MMGIVTYLEKFIDKVFKILPLSEEQGDGSDVNLERYIDGLVSLVLGARSTYPFLLSVFEWTDILNTLYFLRDEPYNHEMCRRRVFEMISLIKQIECKVSEDDE